MSTATTITEWERVELIQRIEDMGEIFGHVPQEVRHMIHVMAVVNDPARFALDYLRDLER